jgi:hypothetical protein
MKIFVVARGGWDRHGVNLVRAFRTEEAREKWLVKIQHWQAEMLGCSPDAIKLVPEFINYEVDLV